jgi:hypothetical protein
MPDSGHPFAFAAGSFVEHVAHHDKGLCKMLLGEQVIVAGSGPLDEELVREMLRACGIEVWPLISPIPDVLVLGQNDWDEEQLDDAVSRHNGGRFRVYSHEMLLATLITGADVYKYRSLDELALFADGHLGLEYLSDDMGFDWPTTDVVLSDVVNINLDSGDWPEHGILNYFGYAVGKTKGLGALERRRILDRVFAARLVAGSSNAAVYVAEWAEPRSAARLQKMANCLASFVRSAKKRSADYSVAIDQWETDLDYLHDTYYVSRRGFQWPDDSC